jgi:hypothetical protein
VSLRDEIEAAIRSWNAYELGRGGPAVVDYDLAPPDNEPVPAENRVAVLRQLAELHERAVVEGRLELARRLDADLAYLRALLGERRPLDEYVRATQQCPAIGWPDAHLEHTEGPLASEDAPDAIRAAALHLEEAVRAATGTTATYDLTITSVDEAAYWSYWLDGAGRSARLRLNLRNARYTKVQVRQFALHEVLGHALQFASLAQRCEDDDVPWIRLMSVHAGHQVLFEGLAQALPLFVTPDDAQLIARVRLAHFTELVNATLHVAINEGESAASCVARARDLMPHWPEARIANVLNDRSVNPLLRSYLWSYPAGLDWFTSLAKESPHVAAHVMREAYSRPLAPAELEAMAPGITGGQGFTSDKP